MPIQQELCAVLDELRQAERESVPASQSDPSSDAEALARTAALTERISQLDGRLRKALASDELTGAAKTPDISAQLIETLQAIDQCHQTLTDAAIARRKVISDTLQQLRHDQRAATTYHRVLRQSY